MTEPKKPSKILAYIDRIIDGEIADRETMLDVFIENASDKGLSLYPAQEEAILELLDGNNVVLKTPTGSGKSLVAAAMHFQLLCEGQRSIYTCPIKALVNEKFLSLCAEFGADNVGISTGDATVNGDAPILCCTAEVLANLALREGKNLDVAGVVMDEFHYYSDRERGFAWQVPLLTLPQTQFLLISATLGNTRFFEEEMEKLTGRKSVAVSGEERPVPLDFSYTDVAIEEVMERLKGEQKLPVYIVHFTQRNAVETAQTLTSINFASKTEKEQLGQLLAEETFNSPFGKEIRKYLRHGIGVHHAGMLPKYRLLVEKLAQKNLLKVICGTDTLGVGVNVPIRTVLFSGLGKFDGQQMGILNVRDFHQISGRAGRKGFDDEGFVVCMAPPHVIENLKQERKAQGNPKKQKKLVKKQPDKGSVVWDEETFKKLIQSEPEGLRSSFNLNHGILLNVLSRESDGCRAMKELIKNCHDSPVLKRQHRRRGWQLFRSLVEKNIVEILPKPEENGRKVRLHVDLQEDFSLNHALSLFLVDTVQKLDASAPEYALVVLTLVESVLENPGSVLRKQVDRLKDELMKELKAEGVSYEERMEKLMEVEHPKPERDFIYDSFNEFAQHHPWVGEENIQPKSIAREMFERYMSFDDYVRMYGLARLEGILLRHLSNVYKTMTQTVPESLWSEPLIEVMVYLEELLRSIDSSILDEWEALRNPEYVPPERSMELPKPKTFRQLNPKTDWNGFQRSVKNAIFTFIRPIAQKDYVKAGEVLAELAGRPAEDSLPPPVVSVPDDQLNEGRGQFPWYGESIENQLQDYWETHASIRIDPAARSADKTLIEEDPVTGEWHASQTLVDADELNDWAALFRIDLSDTLNGGAIRLHLIRFETLI